MSMTRYSSFERHVKLQSSGCSPTTNGTCNHEWSGSQCHRVMIRKIQDRVSSMIISKEVKCNSDRIGEWKTRHIALVLPYHADKHATCSMPRSVSQHHILPRKLQIPIQTQPFPPTTSPNTFRQQSVIHSSDHSQSPQFLRHPALCPRHPPPTILSLIHTHIYLIAPLPRKHIRLRRPLRIRRKLLEIVILSVIIRDAHVVPGYPLPHTRNVMSTLNSIAAVANHARQTVAQG
jgi:hypothetical protein